MDFHKIVTPIFICAKTCYLMAANNIYWTIFLQYVFY